jgi:hypothetical protein
VRESRGTKIYLRFKLGISKSRHPDDGGSEDLRNVGQFQPDYMAQHPRRQSCSYLLP